MWTDSERIRFLEGLRTYGKQWQAIQTHVQTKTEKQVKVYANNLRSCLAKRPQAELADLDQILNI